METIRYMLRSTPFNSINVKAGTGGVRNHEAIVWNFDRIRVRYLVEFGA